MLDTVASPQAAAFDEQHESYDAMSEGEIAGSKNLARRFLSFLRVGEMPPEWDILDVGCGKGELTIGLSLHPMLARSRISALDHSLASLQALHRTALRTESATRLSLSVQDIDAMAFPKESFDLICGNAVLHHFPDWKRFVRNAMTLLRPGGAAIFAEPMAIGYIVPALVLGLAQQEARLPQNAEGLGLAKFILNDIRTRVTKRADLEALSVLIDKHLFTLEEFLDLANELGLTLRQANFEVPEFYSGYVESFFKCYNITNPAVLRCAEEIRHAVYDIVGKEFGTFFPHFKFFVLEKPKS